MSAFTFIHAADLHLGSPLAGLAGRSTELAERFVAAGRDAFTALIDHAIETKVAFVLVAGDLFDGEWSDLSIGLFFARELARLERAGIPFAYVRGNHDAQSIVRKNVTLPKATLEFPSAKASTYFFEDQRVALHGRSFPERTVPEDFVRSYPEPKPGWFNIGLLHTSCGGHPSHATYAPCSAAELASRGYDYWALGHVHDFTDLSTGGSTIIYPGNLQGRSIKECGPKGAVAVEVADARVTVVRRLALDRARFAHLDLTVSEFETEADLIAALTAMLQPHIAAAENRPVALRVTLRGPTPLHDRLAGDPQSLEAEVQSAAHRLHEDVWLEKLRVRTSRPAQPPELSPGFIDPAALLSELDHDPAFRERCLAVVKDIAGRLPGGMLAQDEADLTGDLDQLLIEAEAAIMAHLRGRGC